MDIWVSVVFIFCMFKMFINSHVGGYEPADHWKARFWFPLRQLYALSQIPEHLLILIPLLVNER